MSYRTSLAGGAALGVVLALISGFTAEAATHHKRHHAPVAAKPDRTAELQAEIDELKAEVQSLKSSGESQAAGQAQNDAQLAQMRAQLADADARAQAAQAKVDAQIETIPGEIHTEVAKAAPKTDKLYIKGVSLQFGGFTALETLYRSKAEQADMGSSYSAIPFGNVVAGHTSETRFSARQSRVSALVQANVSDTVKISGYGEFDFLGAAQTANSNESNSYQPRIRNLYTTIDWKEGTGTFHFLGGQSWSLVTMYSSGLSPRSENIPATIEAQYVPGFVWDRQPQIRLSFDSDQHFWFGVSAESPATTYYASGKYLPGITLINTATGGSQFNNANQYSFNRLPDFVAKAAVDEDLDGHKLHAEVFGLYRDFYARVDDSGAYGNESTSGGGVGGGFVVGVIPGWLDLQASGLWGRGIGRYGSAQLPDVTVAPDGTLHPINEWEALVGGTLHIGKQLDIYVYAGEEREQAMPLNSVSPLVFSGVGNVEYANGGCDTEGSSTCVGNTHYVGQVTAGFWHRPYVSTWGKFQWGIQYSYTERAGFTGQGPTAGTFLTPLTHENMVFTSFRFYPF
jgi:hypothetical protein